ncbi:helix-turn-helix domain-containing protein [Bisbaumannia pacifica]|uniref:Helix-turn-helix domain-containing protein n=1 Tax=Bisbaumannia pacifica TaxID=77098 RepID=A0A510X5G5_9GAMM|nr:RodZ domain-containing protein [Halomonas pacifica]GEK46662.1 helix-turn-helix domain-containing protein [Halomonas pacifica]
MSDMHDPSLDAVSSTPSPGALLKAERERQGLSLEQIAAGLNLRPAVIGGLEEDDYGEVPVSAYRRGYLRAYARFLGMDDGPVIGAYNARHGSQEAERPVTPVQVTKPPSRLGAWLFKLVTLLVLLGLVGLTLLWWQSRGGNELGGLEDEAPVAVDSLDGTPANEPSRDWSSQVATDQGPEPEAPAAIETPGIEAPGIETPGIEATPSEVVPERDATTADDAAGVADEADAAPPSAEAADEPATEEEATEEAAAADPRRLELTFNEQSWTEIFDANGQRILIGLQEPGQTASLEGEPPFRLTVGNASGVELRYRGETIDLGARAGANNVARFTLGE